jgi:hypothetical protein
MKKIKISINRCGGNKKSGCSLYKCKKQWEFPYFVEDSIKKAA